jgi:hypothetical protein
MAIGGFVVDRRTPLQYLLQLRRIENLAAARRAPDLFGERQRGTAIAIGHAHQRGAGLEIERQLLVLDLLRMGVELLDRGRIERMEHQHARAREQRRVELEGWVFGGGADQHHGAVFHHGQERVLLSAVESVNLVDKEQRTLARLAAGARRIERLLQVGNAGEDG